MRPSVFPNKSKKCSVAGPALEDAVQLRRAELLHAAERGDVAAQLLKLVVADGDAEVLAGDVLDFVRFIEDHGVRIRG